MKTFRSLTKRILASAAHAILPAQCLLCGDPAGPDPLCPPCLQGLPPVVPACPACALPLGVASGLACGACQQEPPPWARAWAPLRYEFPVDALVRQLKYRGDLAAGAALAEAMLLGPRPNPGPAADVRLVPVPLHWTREVRRGFNQAMELAVALSQATGWEIDSSLVRTRRTAPQAGLNARARQSNLRNAFQWRGDALPGRQIVLIDDVLTTGATARACAHALQGAASLELWMAARALPREASQAPWTQSASSAQRS